jgi:hypothetical protein
VVLPPRSERQVEADALDPAADDHEREAEVEEAQLASSGDVEGVEHGRLVEEERHGGHQQTDHHHP